VSKATTALKASIVQDIVPAVELRWIMRDAVIFDIDGTLADVDEFLHHLVHRPDSPRDWKGFHTAVGKAKVKMEVYAMLQLYLMRDITVIILTSRNKEWEKETENWLGRNQIRYDKLMMRSKGDRRSAPEFKEDRFKKISQEFNIVQVFDDHPGVCGVAEELGIPVTKIPGYEEASLMMEELVKA
jgi:uncharacterized HAD superfamily protein